MNPFHFTGAETPFPRRIEVPTRIQAKDELFDFLARAFPLPAYFGHNWDALEECLLDLGWLTEPEIALIHRDIPLAAKSADQRLYLRILAEAAQASSRLRVTFPAASRPLIEMLLEK